MMPPSPPREARRPKPAEPAKLALVLSGFPRLSETFALNEVLALEARGLLEAIFATKPGDGTHQPGSERLGDRVELLPAGEPAEQAQVIVERLRGRHVAAVHGYFAHRPAAVAAHAARQLGVPYGFSVHARDARKVEPATLAARARGAALVVACNPDVAGDLDRLGASVHLVPHGVDLRRFHRRRSSAGTGGPVRVLAVGRLVEKKGFDVLLSAAQQVRAPFQLRIIGTGPEQGRLAAQIAAAGLGERVTLCGAMTHTQLPGEFARADIVAVPSVTDRSGDRDGLPNVVLEAMASGRPVLASDAGAISSAVRDGETGLLVPAGDAAALARALEALACQPALRERLGCTGREMVEREFELARCTDRLARLLLSAYA